MKQQNVRSGNAPNQRLSDGWYEDEREADKKFKSIAPFGKLRSGSRYARGDAH